MRYIEIDDLVGNAFVSYLEKTGKRVLSLKKINNFADNVIKDLNDKGIEAVLRLSRNRTKNFFYEYSDYFTLVESDEDLVVLNNNVTVKQLIKKFSRYLSTEVMLAFRNEDNIRALLE